MGIKDFIVDSKYIFFSYSRSSRYGDNSRFVNSPQVSGQIYIKYIIYVKSWQPLMILITKTTIQNKQRSTFSTQPIYAPNWLSVRTVRSDDMSSLLISWCDIISGRLYSLYKLHRLYSLYKLERLYNLYKLHRLYSLYSLYSRSRPQILESPLRSSTSHRMFRRAAAASGPSK